MSAQTGAGHTPTLDYGETPLKGIQIWAVDEGGPVVCTMEDTEDAEEIAALIVRAVNYHAELLGALKEIQRGLICREHTGNDAAHYCPNCDNSLDDIRAIARTAIANAERAEREGK